MTDYIYRAQVNNYGESITYRNSEGQQITYKPNDGTYSKKYDAVLLFTAVNQYFTGKSPNITPAEQVKLRTDIAMNRAPLSGITHTYSMLNIYEGIDFVLKTFSDKNSEGGENITPNEVYQMFEIFHRWTE